MWSLPKAYGAEEDKELGIPGEVRLMHTAFN